MRSKFAGFIVIILVVQFTMVYWVHNNSKTARSDLVTSQREGCERSKLDRVANAKFQTAHSTYISTVTGAKSVKEDVKAAARKALTVYIATSLELLNRARINCKEVYP